MAFDYSGLESVALRQINDKGALVDLIQNAQNPYTPGTDSFPGDETIFQYTEDDTFLVAEDDTTFLILESSGTGGPKVSTTVSVRAVITNYNQNEIDGTLIQREDKQAIIAGASVAKPDTFDELVRGSLRYKIVNVEEITPGGTPLLYKLQLRGS